MLKFLGVKASERKHRLSAVACCRTVWELLPDDLTRRAFQVAELEADGQADPKEQRRVLQEVHPKVHSQHAVFFCGGGEGPGTTYAAMAATATLDPALTFIWSGGQDSSEMHTAWSCVAMAQAQTAIWTNREKLWQKRGESSVDSEDEPDDVWYEQIDEAVRNVWDRVAVAWATHCDILRDIFGNPFRPIIRNPSWLTSTVLALANGIYNEKAFDRMPILGDALQDAGCDNEDVLNHCREPGEHVRGCWVIDLLLSKQ